MTGFRLVPLAFVLLLDACVRMPLGPNVMVLPGNGKTFEQFDYDDYMCRDWAARQTGTTPTRVANETTATGAAVGTLAGAATGAAIGAAAGNPGIGAAVGAGTGLLGGTIVGADVGETRRWSLQRRYDNAYVQCMYAKGHQVPVARGPRPPSSYPPPSDDETPGPPTRRRNIPPPPPGPPPPPPSGPSR